MNLLEEFWYGNLEPTEYGISMNQTAKEALQRICRNEEKLRATLTDEQKELLDRLASSQQEYQVESNCLLFQNSFRLGARMMLEVMANA